MVFFHGAKIETIIHNNNSFTKKIHSSCDLIVEPSLCHRMDCETVCETNALLLAVNSFSFSICKSVFYISIFFLFFFPRSILNNSIISFLRFLVLLI